MLRFLLALITAAFFSQITFAADDIVRVKTLTEKFPERIVDLSFKDLHGRQQKISDFKNKKALVIAFREPGCPISEKFGPLLQKIESTYSSQNIAFLFVNVGKVQPDKGAEEDRKKNNFKSPYTVDHDFDFVTALGGKTTTEVFVLSPKRKVLYRGAVSDQYTLGGTFEKSKNNQLISVLEDILAGKAVSTASTVAPGCIVNQKESPGKISDFTYHKHIQPLIEKRCVICHYSEGSAPFSLESYESVSGRKNMIEYVVRKGIMPPWSVDDSTGPFLNDMRLHDGERERLLDWLRGGVPEGRSSKTAKRSSKKKKSPWKLGEPDVIFHLPQKVKVEKDGFMPYQYMRMKTNFTEEKWVKSAEILVHPKVVHHIIFNVLENIDYKGEFWGLPGFSWTIGEQAEVLPENTGIRFPAGSAIGVTVHYQPNGTETIDTTTRIGLRFHDKPPKAEIHYRTMDRGLKIDIPPHARNFLAKDQFIADQPMVLTGISPHMHKRGKTARLHLTYPDGRQKDIFKLNQYNFDFQLVYTFKDPITIPKGTKVGCDLLYDNSIHNPNNPDPEQSIHWGDQVSDEMFLCNVQWHAPI